MAQCECGWHGWAGEPVAGYTQARRTSQNGKLEYLSATEHSGILRQSPATSFQLPAFRLTVFFSLPRKGDDVAMLKMCDTPTIFLLPSSTLLASDLLLEGHDRSSHQCRQSIQRPPKPGLGLSSPKGKSFRLTRMQASCKTSSTTIDLIKAITAKNDVPGLRISSLQQLGLP